MKLSKTQIDRLGNRLREGPLSDSDLRILDDYRWSFAEAYEQVVQVIREELKLEPTGRQIKSTNSIIEKLHRESTRLTQIQDIAGCRIVVSDVIEQERVVASLTKIFPSTSVVDRRINPSYGYRAVHVIPKIAGKLIEIQIRSKLQHLWAELSEKLSDKVDPNIKYGGGKRGFQTMLHNISVLIKDLEMHEKRISSVLGRTQQQEQAMVDAKKRKIVEDITLIARTLGLEKKKEERL